MNLVERLRSHKLHINDIDLAAERIAELEKDREEADRISQEKAEYYRRILRLEKALKPFAGMAQYCVTTGDSESVCVFAGDIRAARAAMEEK